MYFFRKSVWRVENSCREHCVNLKGSHRHYLATRIHDHNATARDRTHAGHGPSSRRSHTGFEPQRFAPAVDAVVVPEGDGPCRGDGHVHPISVSDFVKGRARFEVPQGEVCKHVDFLNRDGRLPSSIAKPTDFHFTLSAWPPGRLARGRMMSHVIPGSDRLHVPRENGR